MEGKNQQESWKRLKKPPQRWKRLKREGKREKVKLDLEDSPSHLDISKTHKTQNAGEKTIKEHKSLSTEEISRPTDDAPQNRPNSKAHHNISKCKDKTKTSRNEGHMQRNRNQEDFGLLISNATS